MRGLSPLLLLIAGCHAEWSIKDPDAPPSAAIQTPSDRDSFAAGEDVALVGVVSDAESPAGSLVARWESDLDGELAGNLVPSAEGVVEAHVAALSPGAQTLRLVVVDPAGNEGEDTVTIGIIPGGETGDSGSNGGNGDDTGDSGSNGSNGGNGGNGGDTGSNGGSNGGDTGSNGGSNGGDSGDTASTVDDPPTVTFLHPVDAEAGLEDTPFAFAFEVTDAEDDVTTLSVDLTSDVDGLVCTAVPDGSGLAGCSAILTVGVHTLTASTTDSGGNTALADAPFVVIAADESDDDHDGYTEVEHDCDDADATIHPDAPEVCDGVDQDCDGDVDEDVQLTFYADTDGDGYGDVAAPLLACEAPSGWVTDATDCDDTAVDVHPTADERCNGLDDDCDGRTDDPTAVDAPTWYADLDGDGFGDAETPTVACAAPEGYLADDTDCDDADADVSPAGIEVCNLVDDNCDGGVDEGVELTFYADVDGDGHGTSTPTVSACEAPAGYSADADDCDDSTAAVSPDAAEGCDGIDDDCDGTVDEPNAQGCSTYYYDGDGDGFGSSTGACLCAPGGGYTSVTNTDCYDANPSANPTATSFQTVNRGDGSFDYNCDGAQTQAYAASYSCSTYWTGFSCESHTDGWDGGVPACGASSTYATGCNAAWWNCDASGGVALQQTCR